MVVVVDLRSISTIIIVVIGCILLLFNIVIAIGFIADTVFLSSGTSSSRRRVGW